MKKVPSALKWLAEKRARIAGAALSAEQLTTCLTEDLADLRQRTATTEALLKSAIRRKEELAKELSALDQVVVIYDETLKPELIQPINGWQGHYGTRGALRGFLVATLKERWPEFVSTLELEVLTVSHFSLVFETRQLRSHWYRGSFRNTVKILATQGLVERAHIPSNPSQQVGHWRWKQEVAPTLAELRE